MLKKSFVIATGAILRLIKQSTAGTRNQAADKYCKAVKAGSM